MNRVQRFFLIGAFVCFASIDGARETLESLQFELLVWSKKSPPMFEIDGEKYVVVNKVSQFSHMRKVDSQKTQKTPPEIIQFLDEKMTQNITQLARESVQSEREEGQKQSNGCCAIL